MDSFKERLPIFKLSAIFAISVDYWSRKVKRSASEMYYGREFEAGEKRQHTSQKIFEVGRFQNLNEGAGIPRRCLWTEPENERLFVFKGRLYNKTRLSKRKDKRVT